MVNDEGGFASSLDADSEHEEGKFYVWSEAEIDAVLGDRGRFVQALLRRDARRAIGRGTTSSTASPIRRSADAETEAALARCREMLLAARAPRVRPGLDDKVLADWNGLMIAALAQAGLSFERADWVALAERAFAFIGEHMTGSRRPAAAQLARGPGAPSGERRRLRQSLPRRAGALRSDLGRRLSGAGAPLGGGARPALLGQQRRAAISLPPTTPRI